MTRRSTLRRRSRAAPSRARTRTDAVQLNSVATRRPAGAPAGRRLRFARAGSASPSAKSSPSTASTSTSRRDRCTVSSDRTAPGRRRCWVCSSGWPWPTAASWRSSAARCAGRSICPTGSPGSSMGRVCIPHSPPGRTSPHWRACGAMAPTASATRWSRSGSPMSQTTACAASRSGCDSASGSPPRC